MPTTLTPRLGTLAATLVFFATCHAAMAQSYPPVVPGTGIKIEQVGDDFEDPDWSYNALNPKSSRNIDKRERLPAGESANGRWYEGAKRGHPDIVRRVQTPKGGLPGSKGALLLQSLYTGIPGRPSYQVQQDDFIADVRYRLGGSIPVWQSPNVVVRLWLPPVDKWENRSGTHFGFRIATITTVTKPAKAFFLGPTTESKTYWPGMFIDFQPKQRPDGNAYAYLRVRANSYGGDYKSKQLTTTGWWTLGMSVTPDGRVHYFAKPGVDDLTMEDHIASEFPYGYRAEHFKTFFFNVCNGDDGRTWSTPFVVDDCEVYYLRSGRTARGSRTPSRR